jgi:Holliday junction resolvase RusA-like endonuclease
MIRFVAYGLPQPGGSKRAFPFKRATGELGVRVTDDNPKAKEWKQAVAWAAREAHTGPLLDGPLEVTMRFYRPRPKGHYKAGERARGLNATGQLHPYPTSRPDVLKLARAAEDALTGVLWTDDARTVTLTVSKLWGDPAGVVIEIRPSDADGREGAGELRPEHIRAESGAIGDQQHELAYSPASPEQPPF